MIYDSLKPHIGHDISLIEREDDAIVVACRTCVEALFDLVKESEEEK